MATEKDVVFHLEFRCTSNAEDPKWINSRGTISFSSCSPPSRVSDLTRRIEETMEIPEMLVKLEKDSAILNVKASLEELRVRAEDKFIVHYYSKAECKAINDCIDWMRELLSHLRTLQEDQYLDINNITNTHHLQLLGFDLFLPWLDSQKYANKLYFISKDGLIILSQIMSILLDIPLAYLPAKLQRYETEMLVILWNITEDTLIRRAVVETQGIEICTRALLRVPVKPHVLIQSSGIFGKEIVRMALGSFAK